MKLQELINKLSNFLASGAAEAEVKIDNKPVADMSIIEEDGIKTVVITSVK